MSPFRTERVSQERSKLMRSVLWLLHYNFFQQVDLQAIMKAGRWPSGGTFTAFYFRDLCWQADSIWKTGTVIAAREIMEISSWVRLVYFSVLLLARAPLSLIFKKGGSRGTPPQLRQVKFFICWSLLWLPQSQNRQTPSLICQILVLSDLSYELFELFVTELKFLDRN